LACQIGDTIYATLTHIFVGIILISSFETSLHCIHCLKHVHFWYIE